MSTNHAMTDLLLPHPYPSENKIFDFYQTDNEDLYLSNKKRLGPDWRWQDRKFTYKFNSHSLRMDKELSEVDYKNYCIFFGCSFTVGHGVPVEETYAYKIANKLSMDYINAGVGGAGPSYAAHNMILFLSKIKHKPKFVVMNWPNLFRKYYYEDGHIIFKLPDLHDTQCYESYKNFLLDENGVIDEFKNLRNECRQICNIHNIPFYEFTQAIIYMNYINEIPDLPLYNGNEVRYVSYIDRVNNQHARDITPTDSSHFGVQVHTSVSDKIIKWYYSEVNHLH